MSYKTEKIVRAQLIGGGEGEGPARLVSIKKVKWGDEMWEQEKPVLRVGKPEDYIDAKDADPRLRKLGEDMEDLEGLATYIAFQQLHDKKQKEVLSFGSPEVYEACSKLSERVDEFLQKRPEYKRWLNWDVYKQLLAVMAHRGIKAPDGSRSLYATLSLVRHSWKPNCVWQTNTERYPLGAKTLYCMAVDGLNKGAELTVSYVPEDTMLKARDEGLVELAKELGPTARTRCVEESEESEDMIRCVVEVLVDALATDPPTAEALKTAQEALKDFDAALPCSMLFKARARQRICQMIQVLNAQESAQKTTSTKEAQKARESQLKEMLELQAQAIKELDLLLGRSAAEPIQKIIEEGYKPIEDESTFLQKYVKKREAKKLAAWQGFYGQQDDENS